jgi:hypothetical protein
MKVSIEDWQITMLNQVQGKLLLNGDRIFKVISFKVEEGLRGSYLTEMVMTAYHDEGRFIGTFKESTCEEFIKNKTNFYTWRNNWENFKLQLKAYNLKIIPIAAPQNQIGQNNRNENQTASHE